MRQIYQESETGVADEHRMEIENRIRNLFWTVSGDYSLHVRPDVEAFARSRYASLYDAVKQGAFARYFDLEQLELYVAKKICCQAQERPLMELTQLCVDAAVYPRIKEDRLGIDEIRQRAFTDLLAYQEERMQRTLFGKVKYQIMERFLGREDRAYEDPIPQAADMILSLEQAADTDAVIAVIDQVYNKFYDQTFEKRQDGHAAKGVGHA